MESVTGIAWTLRAPSADGGKIYVTLVVDTYVLYGSGREDRGVEGLEYKCQHFSSPSAAQRGALLTTEMKEKREYELRIAPTVYTWKRDADGIVSIVANGGALARQSLLLDIFRSGTFIN